jgi:hypothetical protein
MLKFSWPLLVKPSFSRIQKFTSSSSSSYMAATQEFSDATSFTAPTFLRNARKLRAHIICIGLYSSVFLHNNPEYLYEMRFTG